MASSKRTFFEVGSPDKAFLPKDYPGSPREPMSPSLGRTKNRLRFHDITDCPANQIAMTGTINDPILSEQLGFVVPEDQQCTTFQTAFNVVNIFCGLGLLSQGFACSKGGWLSLSLLLFFCCICLHTAKIIVKAFERVQDRFGRAASYPDVAYAVYGKGMEWTLLVIITFEFAGGAMMCLLTVWQNVANFVPSSTSRLHVALVCAAAALPTLWVLRYNRLSFISLLGAAASTAVTGFVLGVSITEITKDDHGHLPKAGGHPLILARQLGFSAGMYLVPLAGHACLPAMYLYMKHRRSYEAMINSCFVILWLLYTSVAVFGYALYGEDSEVLITLNIKGDSRVPNWISSAIIWLVIMAAYATVAPITALLAEAPERWLELAGGGTWQKEMGQRGIRTVILVTCSTIAFVAWDNLGTIESLTGGICTMTTSLICPALFYTKLFEGEISWVSRVGNRLLALFGVFMGIAITVQNIIHLI